MCLDGFDGPNCEQTKLSFSGNDWAWFDHIPACDVMTISLEVTTTVAEGLLLYNGPMYSQGAAGNTDYMVIQLTGGYPQVKVSQSPGQGESDPQVKVSQPPGQGESTPRSR